MTNDELLERIQALEHAVLTLLQSHGWIDHPAMSQIAAMVQEANRNSSSQWL